MVGTALAAPLTARLLVADPRRLPGIVAVMAFAPHLIGDDTIVIAQERTFCGVNRVEETDGVRLLFHRTTLHGAEWHGPDGIIECRTTYFTEGSPYAKILRALPRRGAPMAIGVAGLGTDSLACYVRAG